jgi:ferric-dicitrate binding protein FerR (iron transport regulator)
VKNLDTRVLEFLQDDRFIKWVHSSDEDAIIYWETWIKEHPEEVSMVFKARDIVLDLASTQAFEGAEQLSAYIWTDVQDRLDPAATGKEPAPVRTLSAARKRRVWYWAAACFLGLAGIGAMVFFRTSASRVAPGAQQVANRIMKQDLERTNGTMSNQQVYLVDGTRITLQPGSGIRHAIYLQKDKREVYLEGNAFFEIAKDADRPFYVYTKDLVVRVLGTSFKVITNKENGNVSVLVETGKVSVSKKTGSAQQQLILESNHQALYKAKTRDLVESPADKKELTVDMTPAAPAIPFSFEETPLEEIFKKLENAYGIPFHFDEKTFSSCAITTSLADETFEEKIKIICEAVGATYRIDHQGVWIEGHPCK